MKYIPSKTIREFMLSEKEVKCIIGPLGCLPASSEYLTPEGWKRMDSYDPGDLVGVWRSGSVTFERAEHIDLPAEEDFYRFDSGGLVMELSPEHKMLFYNWNGKLQTAPASYVAHKPSKRTIPTTFAVSSGKPMSDIELRLRVALSADGHIPKAGNQVVFTLRKQRKIDRLTALLDSAGATYKVKIYPSRPTEHVFSLYWPYGAPSKSLSFVYSLDSTKLAIIRDECLFWDGMPDHAEQRFFSSNLENAEAVQYACHGSGRRAVIRGIEHDRWNTCYAVYIRTNDGPKNRAQVRCDTTKITRTPPMGGRKYCFNTSTGFFVARHEGTIFVTGNSGKSMGALMELFRRMCEQEPDAKGIRPTRFAIVRNTAAQLRDTTLSDAQAYFGDFFHYKVTENTLKFRFSLPDGTRIESDWMLMPLERPEDQRKLLSLNLTAAWIEECREVPYDVVAAVRGRIGRYPAMARVPPTWQALLLVSNPWSESSPYHENFVLERPDAWGFFHQPGGLDPDAENVEYLPKGYYERLMEGTSDEWINVHVHSQFGDDQFGQAVYRSSFSRELHIREGLRHNPMIPLLVGIDFGRTPAAIVTQEDMHGTVLCLREITTEDMHLPAFLEKMLIPILKEYYGSSRVFFVGDPAGNARTALSDENCFDVLKSYDLAAIPAPTNDPTSRINAVDKLLLRNNANGRALLVDPDTCPGLTRGFIRDYRFKKKRDGDLTPHPDKNDASHIHDALQYAALGHQSHFVGKRILKKLQPPAPRPQPFNAAAWT